MCGRSRLSNAQMSGDLITRDRPPAHAREHRVRKRPVCAAEAGRAQPALHPSKPNTEQLHDPFDDPENMECMEISDDEFEMMHDRQYLGYCLSDKDIGALQGPLNSVVIGALTPGCCRLARQASAASADDP